MTETGALVRIYGAVDQVAQSDPELRAAISQLLPLYRDPDLHWYEDFQTWLKGTRAELGGSEAELGGSEAEDLEGPSPSLAGALQELAGIKPRCRMRPRRLFAIAVAMRAFPEMRKPHTELGGLAVAALHVSTLAGEEEHALSLQGLLAEEEALPGLEAGSQELNTWWNNLVATAASDGLISSVAGMRPRPCSGRLVTVPGVQGQVAALETEFETDEIDFEQATKFIEPVNWKKCMPDFWCVMKQLGAGVAPGSYLYHEVVSTDCANKATAAFTAEAELEFNFMWLPSVASPQVALTNYQLAPGRPKPGDLIRVDEGSLVVAKTGPGPTPLRITTTKRIRFSYPFSSEALATIMCALGYADVVGNLLCCAASSSKKAGTPFPGEAPGSVEQASRPKAARTAIPGNAAVAVGECIEECAAAAGDWSQRIAEGPYTGDELAQDIANTWARVMRKSTAAMQLGAKRTRTATRPPTRDRSEP